MPVIMIILARGGLVGVKKGLIFISGADCECVWNFKQGQVNIKKDVTPPTQERNEGATKGELINLQRTRTAVKRFPCGINSCKTIQRRLISIN